MRKLQSLLGELRFLQELLYQKAFLERSREAGKASFCRVRKLPFPRVMLLLLNFMTRPSFTELKNFFTNIMGVNDTVTQQALSEARQKIRYQAFQEIFESTRDHCLNPEDISLFHGYRVLAIDGSSVRLTNIPELREKFGDSTPSDGMVCARMSMIIDVLNEMILDGSLAAFSTGERQMAIEGVKRVEKLPMEMKKCIFLMDRGYWSPELFAQILEDHNSFLIRVPNGVTSEIRSGAEDVHIQSGGKEYILRCKRFSLRSGEIETLVTNLDESELSNDEMMQLYAHRWGIETKYDELKNTLKIDTLTSKTYLTVMQDFYATLTLSNFVTYAAYAAQAEIDKKQANKGNKYAYKPNRNVIVTALKDHMIAAVAAPSAVERMRNLIVIEKMLSSRPVPIRPNRSTARPGRTKSKKSPSPRSPL